MGLSFALVGFRVGLGLGFGLFQRSAGLWLDLGRPPKAQQSQSPKTGFTRATKSRALKPEEHDQNWHQRNSSALHQPEEPRDQRYIPPVHRHVVVEAQQSRFALAGGGMNSRLFHFAVSPPGKNLKICPIVIDTPKTQEGKLKIFSSKGKWWFPFKPPSRKD